MARNPRLDRTSEELSFEPLRAAVHIGEAIRAADRGASRSEGTSANVGAVCLSAQAPVSSRKRSMSLEEAILDKVRRLPPAQQEEVLRFADGLQDESLVRMVPSRDRSREMDWIRENRTRYPDQWVVAEGDRLIAADANALEAFAAAKAAGIDVPFLVHVLPEDPLPFVPGW